MATAASDISASGHPSRWRGLALHLLKRVAAGLGLLLVLSSLIFIGSTLLPGDAATAILGRSATPEALAELRERLGLNEPLIVRYMSWLNAFVHGDLGSSLINGRSVADSIGARLGNTLFLAASVALVAVPLAVFLGVLSVRYRGRVLDRTIALVTRTFVALPEFFIGYLLIYILSVSLGWFASSSTVFARMGFADRVVAIALPCLTLVFVVTGHITTMVRASVLDVMERPFIEMAALKGVSHGAVVWRHALPNALSPIINVVLVNLAYLVAGVVVVEVIFVYPGIGQYMVDSVVNRDVPVVQATALLFAGVYIGLNLCADVLSVLANPRLRLET
ncbi:MULTISPECIES: ABC transporter permease [Rhizobium/Agrobacterium group]|uniref:ABC transporter permease n=1 Tax=Rhizobium/Agrobacterium group TaxID=227290 RepID=UPI001573DECB|nr:MULTISPECIES: ABC transporter permease [Rhizobium/Agrobacterium group]NSZ66715.1 ABC transporter permease [Agrobacterium tumefaciens]NTA73164.1 ABC transporter permease [Agrobacterium tumefaciens]NTJ11834.1 ABC transporter permease [Rhizobium lusitanum]WIE42010.1 ABC transporter permease [Agrobacterium tumefaciens]